MHSPRRDSGLEILDLRYDRPFRGLRGCAVASRTSNTRLPRLLQQVPVAILARGKILCEHVIHYFFSAFTTARRTGGKAKT